MPDASSDNHCLFEVEVCPEIQLLIYVTKIHHARAPSAQVESHVRQKYEFLEPELSQGLADNGYGTRDIGVGHGAGLRFSSPWPWVHAVLIGLLLWAGIAALIWSQF